MAVRPEKVEAVKQWMADLGIREQDLEEKFVKGSGHGGQKVNKTNNCVFLKHLPSGIAIKCHIDRSREINRFLARRKLCEIYSEVLEGKRQAKTQPYVMMHR